MAFWSKPIAPGTAQEGKESPLSLKDRLRALKNLPAFFRLVWQTSKSITIWNILVRLVRAVLPLAILFIGKLIIDQVVSLSRGEHDHTVSTVWLLVATEFGLAILSDILSRLTTFLDGILGDLFANSTSIKIMEHASILDLDQFEDSTFYDKLERARQQTTGRTILLSQILSQIQDLVTMVFLAAGLMVFNPWLILLLLLAVIPAFLGESYFNDKSYALSRGQTPERRELDYVRYLGASDETAKEVKIFDLSSFFIDRFKTLSAKFFVEARSLALRRASWGTLFAIVGSGGYYIAYCVMIARAVKGEITIGELTFLGGSFRQLRSSLEGILNRFTSVSQGAVYLNDFFEFFEISPRIAAPLKPRKVPRPISQGFVFEDVGFKYLNSEKWANRHLNFILHAGEKLALVGENGAGKTTLVKLLARLYDPTEGRILLDGVDLREYDMNELRLEIGIIFQDFLKYQMSFAQNIAVGNILEKENRALIEDSARQSLAHALTERFPERYDQALGRKFNKGVELSGGEWQKIALARAYMRNAQLLILDEPTAALDARAEHDVFQRFTELTHGKSAVLISHRFSTVRMADRILVLEKGELAEIGSHEELLAADGRYAELFNLQAQGYR